MFPNVDIPSIAAGLRRDGVAQGIPLPHTLVDEILVFSRTTPCFGNSNPRNLIRPRDLATQAQTSEYIIADYLDGIDTCAAVRRLWNDPALLAIARAYMGGTPHLLRSRLWWSFVAAEAGERKRADFSQQFHFDLDDWMCCKFFFYITETTGRHGPHQYVRTSHRRRPLSLQLSLFKAQTERRIYDIYGSTNVLLITGPSGFGFVEDPFGIHRGTVPTADARLVLEIQYGSSEQQLLAGRYGVPSH